MTPDLRQRNENIDILKIIATFLIVVSHFVPKYLWNGNEELCGYMRQDLASGNFNDQIMMFYNTLGQIGNNLFVVCSAWFLLDSRKCKVRRLLDMEFDLIVLGLVWIGITLLFGQEISRDYVVRTLLPLSNYTYWFFSCYALFYLLHPACNMVLEKLNKQQLLNVVLLLMFLYSIMQFVKPSYLFFTPLVGFITIYFYVAYNKLHLPKFSQNHKANGFVMLGCVVILILMNLTNNFIGLRISSYRFEMARWNNYINLFVILLGISTFNLLTRCLRLTRALLWFGGCLPCR